MFAWLHDLNFVSVSESCGVSENLRNNQRFSIEGDSYVGPRSCPHRRSEREDRDVRTDNIIQAFVMTRINQRYSTGETEFSNEILYMPEIKQVLRLDFVEDDEFQIGNTAR